MAVALTWEQGFPATEGLSPLVERLARLGEHRHLPPSAEPADAPDLRRVESEVFQAGPARMPDGGIEFRFAEGEEAEAEAVAEAVLGICASGIAPSEVAVLYRAPARHAAALAHAFAEAGIAADFDTPVVFGAVPLGRALCGLLGFAAGGGRDLLLAYLRSAFSGADREAVARLEADWRRRGVTDRAALARGARTLGARVVRDLDDISRADGPDARAVERLAARMMASAHGRDGRVTPSADEDARAYQVLVRTLGDLDGLGGEGPLRAGELAEVLRRAEVAGGRSARAGRVRA
ncbi:MAG: hypothetical protein FDZ70_10400 [Actinobacteria bacterium]|nr:MAG: hypothetical protein FDZ70_10400 [Actinomycetota bacterium]